MPASYRNGLYVVEDASDFRTIDRELAAIDERLFLDYEIRAGAKVYRVLYERWPEPPAEIARWPYPLSSGLLELVKSLRPRAGVDLEAALRANAELEARQLADFERDVDEIADDVGPRIRETRSALLHRGVHLRRARARRSVS
jgi:hypothetical protein